jgi:g-D-glutamyl-meso-diaminopimelate peptidase
MNDPPVRFPEAWRANIRGVDLNLQYPAGWEIAKQIKFAAGFTKPGPRDFVGPYPLSEPESRAVYDFTLNRNFRLALAYHTQGKVIFWKYLDYMPPRSQEIGMELSRLSGYSLETTPDYSGHAGYKDWFILNFNRPGYTIEAGIGVNPLPLSQFNEIYRDNVGMLAYSLLATR